METVCDVPNFQILLHCEESHGFHEATFLYLHLKGIWNFRHLFQMLSVYLRWVKQHLLVLIHSSKKKKFLYLIAICLSVHKMNETDCLYPKAHL